MSHNITSRSAAAARVVIRGMKPAAAPTRQRRAQHPASGPGRIVYVAEADRLVVECSIRTVSELNASGSQHWRIRHRRAKSQRELFALCMAGLKLPPLPVAVTWTRHAPRRLDEGDNLNSFAKHLRDQLAAMYGVDDGSDLFRWDVRQEAAKVGGVVVEIRSV
jgi:hypothetical protein